MPVKIHLVIIITLALRFLRPHVSNQHMDGNYMCTYNHFWLIWRNGLRIKISVSTMSNMCIEYRVCVCMRRNNNSNNVLSMLIGICFCRCPTANAKFVLIIMTPSRIDDSKTSQNLPKENLVTRSHHDETKAIVCVCVFRSLVFRFPWFMYCLRSLQYSSFNKCECNAISIDSIKNLFMHKSRADSQQISGDANHKPLGTALKLNHL